MTLLEQKWVENRAVRVGAWAGTLNSHLQFHQEQHRRFSEGSRFYSSACELQHLLPVWGTGKTLTQGCRLAY